MFGKKFLIICISLGFPLNLSNTIRMNRRKIYASKLERSNVECAKVLCLNILQNNYYFGERNFYKCKESVKFYTKSYK